MGEITLSEALGFAKELAEEYEEDVEHEVPNKAGRLLALRAGELNDLLARIEEAEAADALMDVRRDPEQEVLDDACRIIMALGALAHEQDLDIAAEFARQKRLAEEAREVRDALLEADSIEEEEGIYENMSDELYEELNAGGVGGIDIGDNVDAAAYDPDDRDRGYA